MNEDNHGSADVISADKFSIQELREALDGRSAKVSQVLALALLESKEYPEKADDIRKILENRKMPPRLRRSAAIALGSVTSPEAAEICLRNIDDDNELVARSVVATLLKIDDSLSEQNIERKIGKTALRIPLRQIAILHAYRNNLLEVSLEYPKKTSFKKINPKKVRPMRFSPAPAQLAEENARRFSGIMPGLHLTAKKASLIKCGDCDLMFLFSADFPPSQDIHSFVSRKNFIGVVAARFEYAGTDSWETKLFAVIQPGKKKNQVQVILIRPSGKISMAGEGTITGNKATITIKTVKRPGVIPTEMDIEYDHGEVIFKRARAEPFGVDKLVPLLRNRW